jgi:hypothetical protein
MMNNRLDARTFTEGFHRPISNCDLRTSSMTSRDVR